MQTLTQIRQLLAERGLRPKHRLGQNFLHDKNQLAKLIDAANIEQGDLVLEVGPGTGTLTEALLQSGATVIACEIDCDLADLIEDQFGSESNLVLVRGDCLEKGRHLNRAIVEAINGRPFKLVANLPYQIASPFVTTLLIEHAPPLCLGQFVTIQKEVADRLTAQPSTKQYGPLTIIVQALAEVTLIGTLSPSCFWPQPEVTSAMVSITPWPCCEPLGSSDDRRAFAHSMVEMFGFRRKQLGTIWGRDQKDWPEGIMPQSRAEELTIPQLTALWEWSRRQKT